MGIIINLLLNGLAVFVTAYVLPGVAVEGFVVALVVAVILAVVNAFLKPILLFLTLPLNLVTFGLFTFVINALLIMVVDALVSGFAVESFLWALIFSLVLSLVSSALHVFS